MSCSPTTWTGASEVMFGETMREPVTTIVSGGAVLGVLAVLRRSVGGIFLLRGV